jgi:hypothetical protein
MSSSDLISFYRSQNELGDDGVRELLVGMKRLRAKDIGSHLQVRHGFVHACSRLRPDQIRVEQEINLSGCGLTDVALYLITLQ